MLSSQQSMKSPMFLLGLALLTCSFAFYLMTIRAGHVGDARGMFRSANVTWTLSLVSILTSGMLFVLRREKRFIFLIFFAFLIFLGAQYIRGGGETTPLPYPSTNDTK